MIVHPTNNSLKWILCVTYVGFITIYLIFHEINPFILLQHCYVVIEVLHLYKILTNTRDTSDVYNMQFLGI